MLPNEAFFFKEWKSVIFCRKLLQTFQALQLLWRLMGYEIHAFKLLPEKWCCHPRLSPFLFWSLLA